MLREIIQTGEKHTVWYYFHVSLKWNELTGNKDEIDTAPGDR